MVAVVSDGVAAVSAVSADGVAAVPADGVTAVSADAVTAEVSSGMAASIGGVAVTAESPRRAGETGVMRDIAQTWQLQVESCREKE